MPNNMTDDEIFGSYRSDLPSAEPIKASIPKSEYALDMVKGVGRGVEGTFKSIYNLADTLTFDALPDAPEESIFGEATTTAGRITEGLTQFATAFIPVAGLVGKGAQALQWGKRATFLAKGLGAGAVTDFLAWEGHEERLSNLINDYEPLRNPVTEYLAAKEGDGEIEGRLKNAIEGAGLGVAMDGLLAGLKAFKAGRAAVHAGADNEQIMKAMASGMSIEEAKALDPDVLTKLNRLRVTQTQRAKRIDNIKTISDEVTSFSPTKLAEGPNLNASIVDLGTEDIKSLFEEIYQKSDRYATESNNAAAIDAMWRDSLAEGPDYLDSTAADMQRRINGNVKDIQKATVRSIGSLNLVKRVMTELNGAIKQAHSSGSTEDLAKAILLQEKAALIQGAAKAEGSAFSNALNVRGKLKRINELTEKDYLKLIAQKGGNARVKAHFEKLAMSEPHKLGIEVSKAGTADKWWRRHNELWINSILSGVKTQVVNITGNALTSLYLPLEGFVGAALGGDLKGMHSSIRHVGHLMSASQDAFKFAVRAMREDRSILNSSTKIDTAAAGRALSTEREGVLADMFNGFGKVANLPTRTLLGMDEFFKQINYRAAAKTKLFDSGIRDGLKGADLADYVNSNMESLVRKSGEAFSEQSIAREAEELAKGLEGMQRVNFIEDYVQKNYDPKASELAIFSKYAEDVAGEATFTTELGKDSLSFKLQQAAQAHPGLQLIVPFVRTPMNILKFFGQRLVPLTEINGVQIPGLRGLHERAAADMASGDALRIASARGRLAMGTGTIMTFATLAQQGLISGGGPQDSSERKVLQESGWMPYSVKIGDKWVSMQRLDPYATFLGVVGDLAEVASLNEKHQSSNVDLLGTMLTVALTRNITNKSYLQGLGEIFDVLTGEKSPDYAVKNRIASYVPSLIGQTKTTFGDEEMREVRTVIDALKNRIPVLATTLEARRNVLGENVTGKVMSLPFVGTALDFAIPSAVSNISDDTVIKELAALQHGFEPLSNILGDTKHDLTQYQNAKGQTAFDRWLELSGTTRIGGYTMRQALDRLFNSSAYQRLPAVDPSKPKGATSLRRVKTQAVMSRFRQKAKNEMLNEFPALKQEVRLAQAEIATTRRGSPTATLASPDEATTGILGVAP